MLYPTDPGADLQSALISALLVDPGVAALVGDRVYDLRATSPQDAVYPYIAIGESSVTYEHSDGYSNSETVFVVHSWSRANGFSEARNLLRAAEAALNRTSIELLTDRVQSILSLSSQMMRDPDGVSSHGALRIRVLTEPR